MKNFKYKTTFYSQANIIEPEKETLEAFAAAKSDLQSLSALFPKDDEQMASEDLMWFSCNAANPNLANLNHDLITSQSAVKVAKGVRYKQINAEHSRDHFCGVLTGAGFSEYGTNRIISEEEVMAAKGPVNLCVVGCLWRVAGDIASIVEESSNPESENYKKISVSWEVGFSKYGVLLGNKDVSKGIYKTGKDAEPYFKYLRAEGGKGVDENGLEVYRVIEDATFLGIGLTTNPAASVEGILAYSAEEPEMEAPETEDPETETEMPESEDEESTKVKVEIEIEVEAADNKGKTLNKPFRLPSGSNKKFGVYVKNDKGNIVMVKFGDPNMEIKRDDPERRKAYRARHSCDSAPGPKWKANYWSCKMWSSKPVSSIASIFDAEEWDGETEFSQEEILKIYPELSEAEIVDEVEAFAEKSENNENKISGLENSPVNNPRPTMKFETIKEVFASLDEAAASVPNAKEIREFLEATISNANEQYLAETKLKEDAEKRLQDAIAASENSARELEELKQKFADLEAAAKEKEAQDIFDSRFSALAEEYELDAKAREVVAKQIRDLDEEGYSYWLANAGEVMLSPRKKEKIQVNPEEAAASLKEASASTEDIPNSQEPEKPIVSFASIAKDIKIVTRK